MKQQRNFFLRTYSRDNYRKPPNIFGGSDPHQFDEPKRYFRQKYYSACDILEFIQPVLTIESLLIKSANGECHADELKESVLKEYLQIDSLERYLGVLVDVIHLALPQVKRVISVRTICDAMKCETYRNMLSEVHKLLHKLLNYSIDIRKGFLHVEVSTNILESNHDRAKTQQLYAPSHS